jgi:hypothetical protein
MHASRQLAFPKASLTAMRKPRPFIKDKGVPSTTLLKPRPQLQVKGGGGGLCRRPSATLLKPRPQLQVRGEGRMGDKATVTCRSKDSIVRLKEAL